MHFKNGLWYSLLLEVTIPISIKGTGLFTFFIYWGNIGLQYYKSFKCTPLYFNTCIHTAWEKGDYIYTAACVPVVLVVSLSDPVDSSPPGSSVHGILQARILKWVAISSSRGSYQPRDQIHDSCISCIACIFFTIGIGTPLQYSYLENFHGQRSLVDYIQWGCKEPGTTEQAYTQSQGSKKQGEAKPQTCSSGANPRPPKFPPICSIFEKGRRFSPEIFFSDLPCCLTTLIQYIRICYIAGTSP